MDYPTYQANGWPSGSGSIESACRHVIKDRLDGSGMRWSKAGSDALCRLRALKLSESGGWDEF